MEGVKTSSKLKSPLGDVNNRSVSKKWKKGNRNNWQKIEIPYKSSMSLSQTLFWCALSAILLATPNESEGMTKTQKVKGLKNTQKVKDQTIYHTSNIFTKPWVSVLPLANCEDKTITKNAPIRMKLPDYIARGRELLRTEWEKLRAGKPSRIVGAVLHKDSGEIRLFVLERPLYESHRKFPFSMSGALNLSCIYRFHPHDLNGIATNVDIFYQGSQGEEAVTFLGWSFVGSDGKSIINTPGTNSIVGEHLTEEHIWLIDLLFIHAIWWVEGEEIRTLIDHPSGYTGTYSRLWADKKIIRSTVVHRFPFPGWEAAIHKLIHGIALIENIDASEYERREKMPGGLWNYIQDQIMRVSAIWWANKLASFTGRISSAKAKWPFQITPGAWDMLRQYYPHSITVPFEVGIQDPVMSMRAQILHLVLEWTRIAEEPILKAYFEREGAEEYIDAILFSGYNMSVDRLRGFLKEIISKNPTIAYESLISELDTMTTKRLPSGKENQYYRLKGRVVRQWLQEQLSKYYQKVQDAKRAIEQQEGLRKFLKFLLLHKQ